MNKSAVNTGDRYIKVDAPNIFWVVSQPFDVEGTVPNVRLVQEGTANRKITLSTLALQDTKIYKKIDINP